MRYYIFWQHKETEVILIFQQKFTGPLHLMPMEKTLRDESLHKGFAFKTIPDVPVQRCVLMPCGTQEASSFGN